MSFRIVLRAGLVRLGYLGLLLATLAAPAGAQSPVIPTAPPSGASRQTGEDGAGLRRALEAAQTAFRQAVADTAVPAGASREEVLERNHLMGELVASLQHTIEATERLPELRQRVAAQEGRTRDWGAFPTPPALFRPVGGSDTGGSGGGNRQGAGGRSPGGAAEGRGSERRTAVPGRRSGAAAKRGAGRRG